MERLFVQLVIITLGLLIALAREGSVGYIHERQLVHGASANIDQDYTRYLQHPNR